MSTYEHNNNKINSIQASKCSNPFRRHIHNSYLFKRFALFVFFFFRVKETIKRSESTYSTKWKLRFFATDTRAGTRIHVSSAEFQYRPRTIRLIWKEFHISWSGCFVGRLKCCPVVFVWEGCEWQIKDLPNEVILRMEHDCVCVCAVSGSKPAYKILARMWSSKNTLSLNNCDPSLLSNLISFIYEKKYCRDSCLNSIPYRFHWHRWCTSDWRDPHIHSVPYHFAY